MNHTAAAEELDRIEAAGLMRTLVPLAGPGAAEVEVDGRLMLMLSSNNYLGLATHPALTAAAIEMMERYGTGAGASRLVAGDLCLHHDLETRLARFKNTEAALLFNSGYHANTGTISALVGSEDQVFSDALNHASIIDGCRLSRARIIVYPHNDDAALAWMIASAPAARRRLIVTETVFGMDGDVAPLSHLADIAARHGAWLMADEAHATGVFGPRGAGLAEALDLTNRVHLSMGTLGKALGSFGAYVAGSRDLIHLLVNRARSFIYTTAPPPATVAAAMAAVDIVEREPQRRRALWARAHQLRRGLGASGFRVGGESPIVPLFAGDNRAALALADDLIARGIFVRAIRPPTVPDGTARLRLTPMATHTEEQIERAVAAFTDAGRACGLIPRRPGAVPAPMKATMSIAKSDGNNLQREHNISALGPDSSTAPARSLPGADTLAAWDRRHLWHPFTQMTEWIGEDPLIIVRGEGNYLIDAGGHRYLDGVSSLWCNVHGHRRPEIDAAVRGQLGRIAHTTLLGLANEPSIRLARALVDHVPAGLTRVFYSDAGATAVEVALRMALQYCQLTGATTRDTFASLVGAYHGDTLGAVGVGYSETFHRFIRPVIRPSLRLTPPHVFRWERGLDADAALAAALDEAEREIAAHATHLAAVIVEPLMQGAAGMWAHPAAYLSGLRAITTRHGLLLICDEVATGFGRTGKLFACQHAGITPDILCLGKGITGGYMPLAATLATEAIFSAFLGRYEDYTALYHGHTYTGNPLACAAGIASLEIFDRERILDSIQPLIAKLASRLGSRGEREGEHADRVKNAEKVTRPESFGLQSTSHIGDVRQWGLMIGIELVRERAKRIPYPPAARVGARVAREVRRQGVILRPLGDVVILMPPLSITTAELDTLIDTTLDAIRTVTTDTP